MGPILILLVFLGGTMMLIVGGTRVSLYLFTQNALETDHVVVEKPLPVQQPVVERPVYYRVAKTGNTSSQYARGSLMVIGSILLLTMIAAVSMLSGIPH
jgi:hypothetical protein